MDFRDMVVSITGIFAALIFLGSIVWGITIYNINRSQDNVIATCVKQHNQWIKGDCVSIKPAGK